MRCRPLWPSSPYRSASNPSIYQVNIPWISLPLRRFRAQHDLQKINMLPKVSDISFPIPARLGIARHREHYYAVVILLKSLKFNVTDALKNHLKKGIVQIHSYTNFSQLLKCGLVCLSLVCYIFQSGSWTVQDSCRCRVLFSLVIFFWLPANLHCTILRGLHLLKSPPTL
jgi:hypothetical protein